MGKPRIPTFKQKHNKQYRFVIQPLHGYVYEKTVSEEWLDMQIRILDNDQSVRNYFYEQIRYDFKSICPKCNRRHRSSKAMEFCDLCGARVKQL